MRSTLLRAFCLGSVLAAAACDRSPDERNDAKATSAAAATRGVAPLSTREIEDALGAIDTLLEADRPREAEIIARKLFERSGGTSDASPRVLIALSRALLGRSQTQGERLPRAERAAFARESAALAALATRSPDADVEHLRLASLAASTAGAGADALTLARRALEREPGHVPTLFLAATAALAVQNLEEAAVLIGRHAECAPDDPWSAGLEARLALARGDASRAVECATRAVSKDRGAVEFKLILARALTAAGRAEDAVRMVAAMPVAERSRGPVAQVLAEALDAKGDLAAAASAWEPALFASPDDPAVRAEAALAFARAGDRARAETELRVLAALDGGQEERARIDERLRRALGTDSAPKTR